MSSNKESPANSPPPPIPVNMRQGASSSIPPMSLLGLQERAMCYPDLTPGLSALPQPATHQARQLARLPVAPGQDRNQAFRMHLLSVLDEAIRIIDEPMLVQPRNFD